MLQPLVSDILEAANKGEKDSFEDMLGQLGATQALSAYLDESGNTLLHTLVSYKPSWFDSRKKRQAHVAMWQFYLEKFPQHALVPNTSSRLTPLHIAIQQNSVQAFTDIVAALTDIDALSACRPNLFDFAFQHGRIELLKKLLGAYLALFKKSERSEAHFEQIQRVQQFIIDDLKNKHTYNLKILTGAFLSTICPSVALLFGPAAPVYGAFLSMIPVVGPFLGLLALPVCFLLISKMYQKLTFKYGEVAQEKTFLEHIKLQCKLLEEQYASERDVIQKEKIRDKLEAIRSNIPNTPKIDQLELSDWATKGDKVVAAMVSISSFLCSYSAILVIFGAASDLLLTLLPSLAATTISLAGMPIFGWCLLGAAIITGALMAAWYKNKYDTLVGQRGQERGELHTLKYELSQSKSTKLGVSYKDITKETGKGEDEEIHAGLEELSKKRVRAPVTQQAPWRYPDGLDAEYKQTGFGYGSY